ncbi:MAG: hypothetical protein ACHQ7N_06170 [Candidatus Methylomirabilales bacterium]
MNQSAPGKIRLGAVLLVLVVVAGIYLAIQFVPPYWTYLSMTDPVKEAAMAVVASPDEASAKAELIRRAKIEGLALNEDNIEIVREGGMLVVRVTWVAPVELPRYRYNIHFQIEERIPLR